VRHDTALASALVVILGGCGNSTQTDPEPLVAPPATEFQSEPVRVTLEGATEVVETRGFVPDGELWRGFLVDRGSEVREVELTSRACYLALAASTEAMREVDLVLYAPDGTEAAQDVLNGSVSALHVCPPHPGTHYLAVRARSGTGLFAAQVFAGPRGLEVRLDDVFGSPPQVSEP
jgi:hypothetical protein